MISWIKQVDSKALVFAIVLSLASHASLALFSASNAPDSINQQL